MLKLVAAFALLGAIAAGVFLVPVRGRTIAERWQAAPGPGRFAADGYDEARRAIAGDSRPVVPPPTPLRDAHASRRRGDGARAEAPARQEKMPAEHHTAEDRASLDRLLSERSR